MKRSKLSKLEKKTKALAMGFWPGSSVVVTKYKEGASRYLASVELGDKTLAFSIAPTSDTALLGLYNSLMAKSLKQKEIK